MSTFAFPEGWRKASLLDIAKLHRGSEPGSQSYCAPPEGTRFLRVGDLSGKTDKAKQINTRSDDVVTCQKSDLLMTFDGSPGIVATGFEGAISSGIRIIEPNENEALKDYLYYFLQTEFVQQTMRRFSTGATIVHASKAIPHIQVILPPLDLQRKIGDVLHLTEDMTQKRKQASQLANGLIESLFIKKFGDPLLNPYGWSTEPLHKLCKEIYRYPTFYGIRYKPDGVPVVRIGDILKDGTLDEQISNYVFIDGDTNKRFPRTLLEYNDILMAVRGDGSTGKIGRVSTTKLVGANISPNLIRIQPDHTRIHSLYLFHLFSSRQGQALIQSRITRTAKKKITAVELKALEIPVPQLETQQKFARAVEMMERIKRVQNTSATHISQLFQSLMHSAYKGRLATVKITA
jgi:type I restriction enzyme S subunit